AETDELQPERRGNVLDRSERDAGDYRRGNDRLRDHDRRRRVQNLEPPERAASPEKNRDEETDDDRRQSHAGGHAGDEQPAAGKAREREHDTQRNADHERDERCDAGHDQREEEDAPDFDVTRDEERERFLDTIDEDAHRRSPISSSFMPAIG